MIQAIEYGGHHPHGRRHVHTRSHMKRQREAGLLHMLQFRSHPTVWSRGSQCHTAHSPSGTPRCREHWCQSVLMTHSKAEVWPQLWIGSPVRLRSTRTSRRCCQTGELGPSTLHRWENSGRRHVPLEYGSLLRCTLKHHPDANHPRQRKIHDFDLEHRSHQPNNTRRRMLPDHKQSRIHPMIHPLSHILQWWKLHMCRRSSNSVPPRDKSRTTDH